MSLDHETVARLRDRFPALRKQVAGRPAVFFDGPAGTQVPTQVIEAITGYLTDHNANHGGLFATSIESDRLLDEAHRAAADLLGTRDHDTVFFGPNMTTLTFAISRSLSRHWKPGDEIILSRLEHDANFSPWVLAARDRGATVRFVDIDPSDCTLSVDQYGELINDRTRLVAVGCASNAVGTINPVKQICSWAREAGAVSFLDAVHYAPHALINVEDWGCDLLACSAYKFFGPHVGIMYGKREILESLQPYKLRPAPDELPGRWMTGTQSHEGIAGTLAAIDYLAEIGKESRPSCTTRREALQAAFSEIRDYEQELLAYLLDRMDELPGFRVWGITDRERMEQRLPTISITHETRSATEIAQSLADVGIFVWHGNYYALPLTETLGVEPEGMVRIGLCHYNTREEIDHLIESLAALDA